MPIYSESETATIYRSKINFDHYDLYIKGELFEKRIERIE